MSFGSPNWALEIPYSDELYNQVQQLAVEKNSNMSQIIHDILKQYFESHDDIHHELCACSDIALRLDALNPTIPNAFTGTPSERIKRQLEYTCNIVV
jgi:hypothetical protein